MAGKGSLTESERLEFPGASGATLAAVLERPAAGEPRGYGLFAHCFTCTKDIFAARHVARTLAESGIAVLRFDFTGLGESEGEFASSNFTSNVADLVAAARYLADSRGPASVLIGHSLGGAAVLAAASEVPEAKAVCTIAAPADPAHVEHLFTDRSEEIRERGEVEVLLSGRPFTIRRQFLDDIRDNPIEDRVRRLGKALLVCHSPADDTVEVENARRIYNAAKHPKSFLSLDGADHLLTRRRDAEYVAAVLAAWASRYMGDGPEQQEGPGGEAPQEVVVTEAGGTGLAQLIVNGPHELVADEPARLGGGNAGPTPYGLLLAAVGSCTTVTLRLNARREKIPLKKATVRLRHERVKSEGGKTEEVVKMAVKLEGDLDDAQRQRLMEITKLCPVHHTLEAGARIEAVLVGE